MFSVRERGEFPGNARLDDLEAESDETFEIDIDDI
jgi:hypothetical protein